MSDLTSGPEDRVIFSSAAAVGQSGGRDAGAARRQA